MCRNQLGRRNITDEQKTALIGEAYKAQKMSQGAQPGNRNAQKQSPQNEDFVPEVTGQTRAVIAKDFGVGKSTVERAEHFVDGLNAAEKVSPGIKEAVLSGAVKAPKSVISEIRNAPEEQKSYLRGKQYEAEKMSIGGQPGNDNAKNESDKMSSPFKSRRETKDGTAGRIGKQYGVNGRTGENAFIFLKNFPDKSLWKCAATEGTHRGGAPLRPPPSGVSLVVHIILIQKIPLKITS